MICYLSDSRFVLDDSGGVWTQTPHFAYDGWKRGLRQVKGLALCGRASIISTSAIDCSFKPVDCDSFIPLSDFRGAGGLVRMLPRLAAEVFSTVRESEAVVCRVPGAVGVLALLFSRLIGKRAACEVVGDVGSIELVANRSAISLLLKRCATWGTRIAVRQADAVRYMTKSTLQTQYPARRGVPAVALSSVVLDTFWFEKEWIVPAGSSFEIVNIGSMDQNYKGQDLLIDSLRSLRSQGFAVQLTLIGDGRLRGELEDLAMQYGVHDAVRFHGYESDRGILRDLLLGASVFALPSRTEGLPRALLEAMALGMPCVAADVGGCGELLGRGDLVASEDVEALTSWFVDSIVADERGMSSGAANRQAAKFYSTAALEPVISEWADLVVNLNSRDRQ